PCAPCFNLSASAWAGTRSASARWSRGGGDDACDDFAACRGLHLLAGRKALGAADHHAIAGLQCAFDRDEAGVAGADAYLDSFAAAVRGDAHHVAALVARDQRIARYGDGADGVALGQGDLDRAADE